MLMCFWFWTLCFYFVFYQTVLYFSISAQFSFGVKCDLLHFFYFFILSLKWKKLTISPPLAAGCRYRVEHNFLLFIFFFFLRVCLKPSSSDFYIFEGI